MFTRLFRPRWEHSDPRIRRKAFESGDAPAQAVVEAARSDTDPGVRQCAVQRLADLDLLAELAGSDASAAIREAAGRRQRALLAGPLQDGPPLEARLQAVRRVPSPELCAFLARQAEVAELRSAALAQVQDIALLCAVAVDDPVAGVRRAALERIEDPHGWEVVARNARNKDKQISRLARERLDAFHKTRSEQETAERLCGSLEHLAEAGVTAAPRANFNRLTLQWQKLDCPLPTSVQQRFEAVSRRVAEAIEGFEALASQRRALCAELEALLGRVRDSDGQDAAATQAQSQDLQDLRRRWEALTPDREQNDALAEQFAALVEQVEREARRVAGDAARVSRLRKLIETAKTMLDDTAELDERRVKEFKRRWNELELPDTKALADDLQQHFDSVLHALRERLNRQIQQRKQALEEAGQFVVELEQSLQKGGLEHALSLRDRIRHRLKTARGIDEPKRAALQRRLHAMQPQLDTLRDWRHWGSGQSRERLCSEIEALADAALDAAGIAARVRTAREAWKHIDRAEGPAPGPLWERFDAACTRAYAPFQEERREQMAQLQAHHEQKQALCAELEALARDTDWKTVDWSEADRGVRSLRQRWRRIGPVPRKAVKSLEQRYRNALDSLETHLGRERERELRRRRALIARVEALADAADPRAAGDEVKQAQKEWKPTVQADRRTEQALWQQFRTACDAVFQRISAERDATVRELESNLQRKQALCDELDTLLGDADADIRVVTRRVAELGDAWLATGAVPRKAEQGLAARYTSLQKRFAQRQRQAAQVAAQQELDGTGARARLCERLESRVLAGGMAEPERQALLDETEQAWQALAPMDDACEAALRERFVLAGRALTGDAQARQALETGLEKNLKRRLELCLQMEIEAGIESPPEYADARMQLQVSRLEDAFKHRQEDVAGDRLRALQMAWYQAGPAPEAEMSALQARFARAVAGMQRP
jgi:exonuclease SbcC